MSSFPIACPLKPRLKPVRMAPDNSHPAGEPCRARSACRTVVARAAVEYSFGGRQSLPYWTVNRSLTGKGAMPTARRGHVFRCESRMPTETGGHGTRQLAADAPLLVRLPLNVSWGGWGRAKLAPRSSPLQPHLQSTGGEPKTVRPQAPNPKWHLPNSDGRSTTGP